MISKKKVTVVEHPRLDEKQFAIELKAIKENERLFTAQPLAVIHALKMLLGSKRVIHVTGKQIREYLEDHREKLFPSCRQVDIMHIFQGYRSQLERAEIVKPV